MSDDNTVARRELVLSALEKYARQGKPSVVFVPASGSSCTESPRPTRSPRRQARMAPADVARWNAARNAMFQQVTGHLDASTS